MLKIFLVEDEFVVREGIKNNIDWIGEGFHFCGEAADGELAYPRIQAERPDIILTDIKMPFMNGLELSRLIKNELPDSKIIILSGHEEFSYAQEAIKIGVTEYLLKPISGGELIKIIKRVGKQILRERYEKENLERYLKDTEESATEIIRRFFNDLLEGTVSIASLMERGNAVGIELNAQFYQIILFKFSILRSEDEYSDRYLQIERQLTQLLQTESHVYLFDRDIDGYALLLKSDSLSQMESMRNLLIEQIKNLLISHKECRFFGGIGTAVSRLSRIKESYESAARAFARRFIVGTDDIITCDEIVELISEDSASLNALELSNINLKKVEAFLRNGEFEEIDFFAEAFLKCIGSASEKSILFKQYILMNIYFAVSAFLREIGGVDSRVEESLSQMEGVNEVFETNEKAKDYMVRLLKIAIERRNGLRSKRYHTVIEKAKKYLIEHFSEETLTLNEIAAYVNISPNHFSAVYSKETGNSFIKDLTELRLSKAKELLKYTDMRCSEISIAVGYKDPHYFSYLFKKSQSCSPMQYRLKGGLSNGNVNG